MTTRIPARMQIPDDGTAVACERCGFPTLRVAELVSVDGTVVGKTMVCTSCRQLLRPEGPGTASGTD
ncbi:hypothetical protein [Amycolatopsis sp. NPDC059021]|uniref:hypothetical protein n=1 Tax=Amycolatopsis sp. NPDC059021 TaxID=3346704 RepID=UPI00366B9FAC